MLRRVYNCRMNTRHNPGRAIPTALIVVAAFAAGLGLWPGMRTFSPATPAMKAATLYPAPRAIADFSLTRADGKPLMREDWKGRWTVAFFGFTNCPDVCPTTLAVMKDVHAKLAAQGAADKVQFHFISVDPDRDTPEQLARYVKFFSPDFVGATGKDDVLTPLTRSLGLLYTRTPTGNGDYSVDHSASIVIVAPDAQLVGLFRPPFEAGPIADDLLTLAGSRR
jgi:protein SCO1/2